MGFRKTVCFIMACFSIAGFPGKDAGAVNEESNLLSVRASGRFSFDVYKHELVAADTSFPLEAGETVTITAVYSPRSANVDFGLIAPDGLFYPISAKNGSFDETITVDQRGYYS